MISIRTELWEAIPKVLFLIYWPVYKRYMMRGFRIAT